MKLDEALELLEELEVNEEDSHYAKAIRTILKDYKKCKEFYDTHHEPKFKK